MIADGTKVKFDYTLTVAGEVIDSSKGKEPLEYVQGQGAIILGLEAQMKGLKTGDKKTIIVGPEDAYGPVREEAIQSVPKNLFPPDVEIKEGMVVPLQDKSGRSFQAVVREINDSEVVLDLNHPLAGKELTFDVEIVDVQ